MPALPFEVLPVPVGSVVVLLRGEVALQPSKPTHTKLPKTGAQAVAFIYPEGSRDLQVGERRVGIGQH
jgi:hypothetical protein